MTNPFRTPRRQALGMGLFAFLAVLVTLGGPGITIDEPLDVKVGRRYVEALGKTLNGRFHPTRRADIEGLFADNAQHPPLGRWLLGFSSTFFEPFESILGGPDAFAVHPARVAPALAFGILVGLMCIAVGRRFGSVAGLTSAFALLCMPRLFAHAHFATLDSILNLFWVGTILAVGRLGSVRSKLAAGAGLIFAGMIWGLALLTKIHAWLLPPLVLGWLIWRWGARRGIAGFAVWAAVGLLVFLAGWPWLWFDTLDHLRNFLATSTERLALRVQYFGSVYRDRDVPWHYPWFYFAATVPVGLQLLGAIGVFKAWDLRRADPFPLWLLTAIILLLVVFSTNAPVYDGERLFLPVFPIWAVLVGLGADSVWHWSRSRTRRIILLAVLAAQGYGVVALHPFGLSYFNLLTGGLRGAEALGMELTYWGDAVDHELLDELARRANPGQTVDLAPTLHHIQPAATMTLPLHTKQITLQAEGSAPAGAWLVVFRRTAYLSPETLKVIQSQPPVFVRSRRGVWLSGIWRGAPSAIPATPD